MLTLTCRRRCKYNKKNNAYITLKYHSLYTSAI
nr:MAG TPA: hypothetical protein [Caudoviricetes sp.]